MLLRYAESEWFPNRRPSCPFFFLRSQPPPEPAATPEPTESATDRVVGATQPPPAAALTPEQVEKLRHKLLAYKQRLETLITSQKELQTANDKLEKQLSATQDTAAQKLAELKEGPSLAWANGFLGAGALIASLRR